MVNCLLKKTAALQGTTYIDNIFMLEYMPKAPEEYVKVYLFGLMQCQNPLLCSEDMSLALSLSDEKLTDAFLYWQRLGLVSITASDPLYVEYNPIHVLSDLPARGKYTELIDALRNVLGTRVLTGTELNRVYDWMEIFGLSEDAVRELVAHCLCTKGSRVSVNYMDAVAKKWADNGIVTGEDAKAYLSDFEEAAQKAGEIKKRWKLSKIVTEDELAQYKKWTDEWHFSHEAIIAACSDVTFANKPSFGYLDKVLEGYYHKNKLDIDALDEYRKDRSRLEELTRQMFVRAGLKSNPRREQCDEVETWREEYEIPPEVLLFAAESACGKNHPFSFIRMLATSWHDKDILNLHDAKLDFESGSFSNQAAARKKVAVKNYEQRKYTEDELKDMGISFGEDLYDS